MDTKVRYRTLRLFILMFLVIFLLFLLFNNFQFNGVITLRYFYVQYKLQVYMLC